MAIYTFNDIIGQTNTKEWLQAKLEQDKVPHVLMFTGAPGIGKTSMAKVLACELACKDYPDKIQDTKNKVIGNNVSTDCVSLYNMSEINRDESLIQKVTDDLTVGLSSTGRKVIIMDEAHGMSPQAQDSLLTKFESLEDGVYIIICTTELRFKDPFLSRCIRRQFRPPTTRELNRILPLMIEQRGLKFEVTAAMAIQYILLSCNNEPRRIINLLDSLNNQKIVTKEDLIEFGITQEDKTCYQLVRYIYNDDVVNAIQFVQDVESGFFKSAITVYIEMMKVMLGGTSAMLSKDVIMGLYDNKTYNGPTKLMKFVSTLCTKQDITKPFVIGLIISICIPNTAPMPKSNVELNNITTMNNTEWKDKEEQTPDSMPTALTMESLFANASIIEE